MRKLTAFLGIFALSLLTLAMAVSWMSPTAVIADTQAAPIPLVPLPQEETSPTVIDLQEAAANQPQQRDNLAILAAPQLLPMERAHISSPLGQPSDWIHLGKTTVNRRMNDAIQMTVTVGTDWHCDGSGSSTITVAAGERLVYCYIWANHSPYTFNRHDLVDSEFSALFEDLWWDIYPGDVYAFFLPTLATTTTVNTAVWTAYDDVTPITQTAVASATVIVSGSLSTLPYVHVSPTFFQSVQPTDTQRTTPVYLSNGGYGILNWQQTACPTPTASWLTISPISGTVAPNWYRDATITFDSTGLLTGTYSSELCLATNDPTQPTVTLTAELDVVSLNGFDLDVTVNNDWGVCGPTDVITITPGDNVLYCYTIVNGTNSDLFTHELESSSYGSFPVQFPLLAGETAGFYLHYPVYMTTTEYITWTAFAADGTSISATDSVTIYVDGVVNPVLNSHPGSIEASLLPDYQLNRSLYVYNQGTANLDWSLDDCSGSLPSWLSLDNVGGTLPPWQIDYVNALLDSSGLITGTYATNLCLITNDPNNITTTIPVTLTVQEAFDDGLTVVKTVTTNYHECGPEDVIDVPFGTEVTFCYEVTNSSDSIFLFHDVAEPAFGLLFDEFHYAIYPDETVQFILPVFVTESVVSTVTWTSYADSGAIYQDSDSVVITVSGDAQPEISVTPTQLTSYQSPDTTAVRVLAIDNNGFADLNWSADDCSGTLPTWLNLGGLAVGGTLGWGDTAVFDVTFDSSGLITDTYQTDVCVSSNDPVNPVITVPVTLNVQEGATWGLVLTKTVGTDNSSCAPTNSVDIAPGTEVTYCYQIENRSGQALLFHDVEDSSLGLLAQQLPYSVLPGERVEFILMDVTISQTTTSTTTWTAYTDLGEAFTDSDTATVNVLPPSRAAIDVSLTVGVGDSCAAANHLNVTIPADGLEVTYCYQVTNQSPYLLDFHDVSDTVHGLIMDKTWHDLEAGEHFVMMQTITIYETTHNALTWKAYINETTEATASATATVRHANNRVFLPLMTQ